MKKIATIIIALIICVIAALFIEKTTDTISPTNDGTTTSDVRVHIIDVGQGDGIWIDTGNENIVIDAGNKGQGKTMIAYLEQHGVKELDAIISTHPDAGHVGGLADVINHFPVKAVYAPRVTHTTQAYKEFLEAVKISSLLVKSV